MPARVRRAVTGGGWSPSASISAWFEMLRLLGRCECGGPSRLRAGARLARAPESRARRDHRAGRRQRRAEGRDNLGHLLLRALERLLECNGRGEVPRLAVAAGERLVGDLPHELLEEAVLAALGRARIGLEREHLLAHERGEQRLELRRRQARERGERLLA